jgi:hypothetical protein
MKAGFKVIREVEYPKSGIPAEHWGKNLSTFPHFQWSEGSSCPAFSSL